MLVVLCVRPHRCSEDDRIQTNQRRTSDGAGTTARTTPYTSLGATDLLLGDYAGCGGGAFEGAIDEPKIRARTLSRAEIADDMRFEFKGVFSPVDNSPVVNTANAGSNVPVRFQPERLSGHGRAGRGRRWLTSRSVRRVGVPGQPRADRGGGRKRPQL